MHQCAAWVLTGYLLVGVSHPPWRSPRGSLRRRKVFLIGTVVRRRIAALRRRTERRGTRGRVLEGVGAAMLTPGSLAILQASP